MSEELPYRSLAAVSIAKAQEQIESSAGETRSEEGGRFYATIHRASPLMPLSLRGDDRLDLTEEPRAAIDTFVIPKMSG